MASNEIPWEPVIHKKSKIGYDDVFRGLGYSEDQVQRIMYALRIQESDPEQFKEISEQIKKEREEEAIAYIQAFENAKTSSTVDNNDRPQLENGEEAERAPEQSHTVSVEQQRDRLAFDS